MFHKLKIDAGSSKAGEYIDVHEDQKDDLVKRGLIEEDGVDTLPEPEEKPAKKAKVSTTADLNTPPA